jgi:hypothetical protein
VPASLSFLTNPLTLPPTHHPHHIHTKTAYEDVWPLTKANTILNVCPQGERYVVERFGKLLDIKESGWFLGEYVRTYVANIINRKVLGSYRRVHR